MTDEQGLRQAQPERVAAHWAEQYQTCTWESGAHGPDAWDCWSFFRHVQAAHFGRAVPEVGVDASNIHAVARAFGAHEERVHWLPVDAPVAGDAVLMAHSRHPSHVGVWLDVDGGGVLHCQHGAGVIFTPANKLRACGWARVMYFRPKSVRPFDRLTTQPEPVEGLGGFDRLSPNGGEE